VIAVQPLAYWEKTLVPVDCCVTPVLRINETLVHQQFVARQVTAEVDGTTQFSPPFKLSNWPWTEKRPASTAGGDSNEVLRAVGYSVAEIETLRRDRVI
jgi:crotonobetainyl-CoA:carnitine CoA-transferase CaiB-like acyl-CoA transferase